MEYFTEKPNTGRGKELINGEALWNGGVFAFRLGYLTDIVQKYIQAGPFQEVRNRYGELPKISYDYEVAEKAQSVEIVPIHGVWKDLGTWDALSEVLESKTICAITTDSLH